MAKYKVILKGVRDSSESGRKAFLDRFASSYNMTPEKAREFIQRSQGVLYTHDDLAPAEQGKTFLETMGGIVEIRDEAGKTLPAAKPPPPPAPAPPVPKFGSLPGAGPSAPTATPSASAPVPPAVPDFDDAPGPTASPPPPAAFAPPAFPASPAAPVAVTAGSIRPCPKCDRPVKIGSDQCPYCGIFIGRYEEMMARRSQAAPGGMDPIMGPGMGPGMGFPQPYQASQTYDSVSAAAAAGVQVVPNEATNALIYGIIGIFCTLVSPVAIYFGFKAMNMINADPRFTGKARATIGLMLGIGFLLIHLLIGVGSLIYWQRAISEGMTF